MLVLVGGPTKAPQRQKGMEREEHTGWATDPSCEVIVETRSHTTVILSATVETRQLKVRTPVTTFTVNLKIETA